MNNNHLYINQKYCILLHQKIKYEIKFIKLDKHNSE